MDQSENGFTKPENKKYMVTENDNPALNVSMKSYGCKVNVYDSGLLQKRLSQKGFQFSDDNHSQIFILNTCAVTAEATKEAQRDIRKIKQRNPESLVVVTGCSAQVDTDKFVSLKEADLIVANSHKGQLESIIQSHLLGEINERVFKSNIFKKEDLEPGGGIEKGHTRSFLKIQDGCNSFCTFCVIPFARGKSRSLSIEEIVKRTHDLYEQGIREVVLTGVHIGDYQDPESNKGLESLVETVLEKSPIQRFRLSSLEPIELTGALLDLFDHPKLCPHFHMSIQSCNSKVLKDMKRNYSQSEVLNCFEKISKRQPNAFVGMDVIVGFPGETKEEFLDTYQCLENSSWSKIHVFPYSPRPGTYADRLQDQLARSQILERSARLRGLSSERFSQKALEQIGKLKDVMILKNGKALSDDYWQVQFEENSYDESQKPSQSYSSIDSNLENSLLGSIPRPGDIIKVKVNGYDYSESSRGLGILHAEKIQTGSV